MRRSRPDAHTPVTLMRCRTDGLGPDRWTPSTPLVLVQTWLLLLLLVVGALIVLVEARHDAQAKDRALVLGVARTVANSPFVSASAAHP